MCGGDSFTERGLIPRTLSLLFDEIKQSKRSTQKKQKNNIQYMAHSTSNITPIAGSSTIEPQIVTFKCQITFVEIYKDTVYDLLPPIDVTKAPSVKGH